MFYTFKEVSFIDILYYDRHVLLPTFRRTKSFEENVFFQFVFQLDRSHTVFLKLENKLRIYSILHWNVILPQSFVVWTLNKIVGEQRVLKTTWSSSKCVRVKFAKNTITYLRCLIMGSRNFVGKNVFLS